MNLVLRVVLAVVAGVLIASLLDYFNVLDHSLNVLIGFIVAIVVYFYGFK